MKSRKFHKSSTPEDGMKCTTLCEVQSYQQQDRNAYPSHLVIDTGVKSKHELNIIAEIKYSVDEDHSN